ncbi:hypothetical protein [Streptomyces sp. NPDC127040]|uniref:hypothetical protein n=1 Tax=Streptomyces sp. NPDC127040 TaxID=3347116 RepID=UPI00364785AE
MDRIKGWGGGLNPFAILERLLIAAALVLMAITVGGQLGQMIGLHGKAALVAGWAIAIVYDALWIGALRMSEVAIRQRSKVGMAVFLGVSAIAIGVSVGTLLVLGHAQVFAGVPVAAAVLMGLRIFADNMLADPTTAAQIAEQSAEDRNARALAAADARHLRSEARTEVLTETAGHLAELDRQTARAEVLTAGQREISKARAKAEEILAASDKKHGKAAAAFMSRDLGAVGSRPMVTPSGHTPAELGGHTVVTQVTPEIEAAPTTPVTEDETDTMEGDEQGPIEDDLDLEELADLARVEGIDPPQLGVPLTDEQLTVTLRWIRHGTTPPSSYRRARLIFRAKGFQAREQRIRDTWCDIKTRESSAN